MTVLTTTGDRHAPPGRSIAEDGGKPAILSWARKPERSEAGKIVERRRCVDTIGALARTFRRYRPSSEKRIKVRARPVSGNIWPAAPPQTTEPSRAVLGFDSRFSPVISNRPSFNCEGASQPPKSASWQILWQIAMISPSRPSDHSNAQEASHQAANSRARFVFFPQRFSSKRSFLDIS